MTQTLASGQLLAAISTTIVGMLRDHYGRGPMKAKTYAFDDMITCVMRDTGFTPLEKTLIDNGEADAVMALRRDFQRVIGERYKQAIEELTGRKVLACLVEATLEPDITVAMFFIDTPLPGFGSAEPEGPHYGQGLIDRRSLQGDRRKNFGPRPDAPQ